MNLRQRIQEAYYESVGHRAKPKRLRISPAFEGMMRAIGGKGVLQFGGLPVIIDPTQTEDFKWE
jgi:hypothetical protein